MVDVRTYRAANMQEALALVRRELGSEAVILHTRDLGRGLLNRLRRRQRVEVTAGVGMKLRTIANHHVLASVPVAAPPAPVDPHFETELRRLSGMVEEVVQRSRHQHVAQLPDHFVALHAELVEADVAEATARELVYALHDEWRGVGAASMPAVRARLCEVIAAQLQVYGPIQLTRGQRRIVALVGPTGVGKTTTIAKLAANFRLRVRQRVGLITVDTYRVAAIEHLRAYAEIIDLPMQVVMNARDMKRALSELEEMDLILIDTAGRSPREELKIQELKSLLHEAGTHEVHLVLSAAANLRSMLATVERFRGLGLTSMLLTKLDEAVSMGGVLEAARGSHLPLSYVTTGQNVPDDIEVAEAGRLARMLLGQETLRA